MDETTAVRPQADAPAPRRDFLKAAIAVLLGLNLAALGVPLARAFLFAAPRRRAAWAKVGPPASFPEGVPVEVRFPLRVEDGFLVGQAPRSAWIIRRGESITVFSPICTHLGCHFAWDAGAGRFECPCHASVFALDGRVLSGPAPRPLDPLEHRVEGGVLLVRWQAFLTGTAQRIPA